MTEGYDPARCDLCGAAGRHEILRRKAPSLTSDSRVVDLDLVKLACHDCGLVRSGSRFDAPDLERHYGREYVLGVDADRAEPLLPSGDELVARSLVFARWLEETLDLVGLPPRPSVVEIGCGEGLLLRRLADARPALRAQGLELGLRAIDAARRRGLDVRIGGFEDLEGRYDLVFAIAVLEHLPSPRRFFAKAAESLTDGGILIVAQPTQDQASSDIFFVDHLWHFATPHVEALAGTAGLAPILPAAFNRIVPTFSLHTFRTGVPMAVPAAPVRHRVSESIETWQSAFERADEWLARRPESAPLAVWGVGQTYELFAAYSSLGDKPIACGIDDNLARFPAGSLPFSVGTLEDALRLERRPDVLLTFPPPPDVVRRLRRAALRWFAPIAVRRLPRDRAGRDDA